MFKNMRRSNIRIKYVFSILLNQIVSLVFITVWSSIQIVNISLSFRAIIISRQRKTRSSHGRKLTFTVSSNSLFLPKIAIVSFLSRDHSSIKNLVFHIFDLLQPYDFFWTQTNPLFHTRGTSLLRFRSFSEISYVFYSHLFQHFQSELRVCSYFISCRAFLVQAAAYRHHSSC